MEIVFHNKNGRPVAYTQDRVAIYLYTGEPVAYLHQDALYALMAGTWGGLSRDACWIIPEAMSFSATWRRDGRQCRSNWPLCQKGSNRLSRSD